MSEKLFDQLKSIFIFLFIILGFIFIKDDKSVGLFFIFAFISLFLLIKFILIKDLGFSEAFYKFVLSFYNITSLIYLLGKIFNINIFNNLLKTIYEPFFKENLHFDIFIIAVFIISSVLLISFNSFKLGEKDG